MEFIHKRSEYISISRQFMHFGSEYIYMYTYMALIHIAVKYLYIMPVHAYLR